MPRAMRTRILMGIVLAILAVVLVVRGGTVFAVALTLVAIVGLNEFYALMRVYRPIRLPGLLAVLAMMAAAEWGDTRWLLGAVALSVALVALLGMAIGPKPGVSVRIAVTLLGALYVGLGFAHLLLMRDIGLPDLENLGRDAVLLVVFGTWAGDTIAYFTGRWFGSTPMAPVLSPKKTWEGFAGGLIGTVLVVVFLGLYVHYDVTEWGPFESIVLAFVIGVAGPLGDLFESLLKCDVPIKDSGRGIPGHGGVLDRFDALLWSSVAAYYVLTLGLGF
jgi:phosphatidate cytidylyltransferase